MLLSHFIDIRHFQVVFYMGLPDVYLLMLLHDAFAVQSDCCIVVCATQLPAVVCYVCYISYCGPSSNFVIQATLIILMMMMMMMMMMILFLVDYTSL